MHRKDVLFVFACMFAYALVVLAVPPYTPLIEPDSSGYLTFDSTRSAFYPAFLRICIALGLDLVQITWVQLAVFTVALGYLLATLLRNGFPKLLIGLFVAVLAVNVLFSSFHRSIMAESIYFSMSIVVIALWIDYFRTGKVLLLGLAGLVLGLMIGIRPAGIGLVPLHALAAWLKWSKRSVSAVTLVATLVAPVVLGIGGERLLYRVVQGDTSKSLIPNLLLGKAAMLVRPNTIYTGPHAPALNALGAQLNSIFEPAQQYLADAPSLPVRTYLSAYYESQAHFGILSNELAEAAKREGVSADSLRSKLGLQAIFQNIAGYLKLALRNDLGQWSVALGHFPPTARALARYADANPGISFGGRIGSEILHPAPTMVGLIAYPAFLAVGFCTLLLSAGVLVFLARPSLADSPDGFHLLLAVFFSAMCHGYTLFISLVNVWTPRFLMGVFPQLAIIALCLAVILLRHIKIAKTVQPA